jgi:hypothetical protein
MGHWEGKREGSVLLERRRRAWMDDIKINLKLRVRWRGTRLSVSRQRLFTNASEHGNKPSVCIKFWELDIQRTVHRDIFLYNNKNQIDAVFLKFILINDFTCFGQI